MRRFVWGLVLFQLSSYTFADVSLSDLVDARNRKPDAGVPKVTYSYFKDSAYIGEIGRSANKLQDYSAFLSRSLIFPESYTLRTTRGKHYLQAVCYPFLDTIELDESAWATRSDLIVDGLLGHELGHVAFRHSMMAMLLQEIGPIRDQSYQNVLDIIVSDVDQLEGVLKFLEQRDSALSRLDQNYSSMHHDLSLYGTHQLLKNVLKARKGNDRSLEKLKGVKGQQVVTHVLMESLGGFQEVFADLMGAVYTKNPRYLTSILRDPLSKLVRDFTRQVSLADPSLESDLRYQLITSASRGIPHLLLYELRQEIYNQFYLSNSTYIGANPEYDRDVLAKVMESLMRVFVKVYNDPAPKVKFAEATLAYLYREMIGDLVVEYEIEAKAFCTKYKLRRVYVDRSYRHQISRALNQMSFSSLEDLMAMAQHAQRQADWAREQAQCRDRVASESHSEDVTVESDYGGAEERYYEGGR